MSVEKSENLLKYYFQYACISEIFGKLCISCTLYTFDDFQQIFKHYAFNC